MSPRSDAAAKAAHLQVPHGPLMTLGIAVAGGLLMSFAVVVQGASERGPAALAPAPVPEGVTCEALSTPTLRHWCLARIASASTDATPRLVGRPTEVAAIQPEPTTPPASKRH